MCRYSRRSHALPIPWQLHYLREFGRANSRHPGSSARGGGSGPPRRVPDSGATGATVATGAAPSGSHFRAPLSRMRHFAVTAAGQKPILEFNFEQPLPRMRHFAVTAAGQKFIRELSFEHPCRGCGTSLRASASFSLYIQTPDRPPLAAS